uniref:Protein with signal anchor n=1 Tax=Anopheles braziliensis TaxID=58242 RepID=A0A2M3ZA39_9DIPT
MDLLKDKLSRMCTATTSWTGRQIAKCGSSTTLGTLAFGAACCGTLWYEQGLLVTLGAFLSIGALWCRHCASVQVMKSPRLDEQLFRLRGWLGRLRNNRPYGYAMVLGAAALPPLILFCVLSWWMLLVTLLTVYAILKWTYGVRIVFNHGVGIIGQEQQFELEVQEFLPEINELSQTLLRAVGDRGDIPLHIERFGEQQAVTCTDRDTATNKDDRDEMDEDEEDERYISMLLPDAESSRELETVEQTDSSSDELLLDETEDAGKQQSRLPGDTSFMEFKISHFNANSSSSDSDESRGITLGDSPPAPVGRFRSTKAINLDQYADKSGSKAFLVGAMVQCLMDAAAVQQQVPTTAVASANFASSNSGGHGSSSASFSLPFNSSNICGVLGGAARSIGLQPVATQPTDDSTTDDDKDSDFEILNPEELSNL